MASANASARVCRRKVRSESQRGRRSCPVLCTHDEPPSTIHCPCKTKPARQGASLDVLITIDRITSGGKRWLQLTTIIMQLSTNGQLIPRIPISLTVSLMQVKKGVGISWYGDPLRDRSSPGTEDWAPLVPMVDWLAGLLVGFTWIAQSVGRLQDLLPPLRPVHSLHPGIPGASPPVLIHSRRKERDVCGYVVVRIDKDRVPLYSRCAWCVAMVMGGCNASAIALGLVPSCGSSSGEEVD